MGKRRELRKVSTLTWWDTWRRPWLPLMRSFLSLYQRTFCMAKFLKSQSSLALLPFVYSVGPVVHSSCTALTEKETRWIVFNRVLLPFEKTGPSRFRSQSYFHAFVHDLRLRNAACNESMEGKKSVEKLLLSFRPHQSNYKHARWANYLPHVKMVNVAVTAGEGFRIVLTSQIYLLYLGLKRQG